MDVLRHPELAEDIREIAEHYERISDLVLSRFWTELDAALASVERNPRMFHYDSSGLRRANLRKFPYHLLFEVDESRLFLIVFRHDGRHPEHGLDRTAT